ncbi:MAG: DUF507 domain-containing protein [Acidobacteria bacterium]|nr:MAG: DUF507 domain-containing protein [Acidobacteriota bacterium]
MRLSREKIVRISHQITEVLVDSDDVEFIDDRDTIRQQIVQILTAMLREEENIELEVRRRITSQKKEILEGSEEWDVLHKKYYHDELRRMGIASAPDEHRRF